MSQTAVPPRGSIPWEGKGEEGPSPCLQGEETGRGQSGENVSEGSQGDFMVTGTCGQGLQGHTALPSPHPTPHLRLLS